MHDHHDENGHRLTRRTLLKAAAAFGAGAAIPSGAWAVSPAVAAEMGKAAAAWLASLDAGQRARAQFPWTDSHRDDWHYIPRQRPGVPLGQMNAAQSTAAWDLLGALLSQRGLNLMREQFKVEGVLGEIERNPSFRDPGNYALVVFGDPAAQGPWSWRAEGHHLSLTTVVAPGHGVAVTPNFIGANPMRVPDGHRHHGFRLLGAEEDAAFGLIRSIEGDLRGKVLIADRAPGDIIAGPGREDSLKRYEGAPLSDLNDAQRDGVMGLLQLYADTMRSEIAAAAMTRIKEGGVETLHFAWAGSLAPGKPHYFRIHGPRAFLEYDNTQDGANHAHSIWLDPQGMFGRDLLKAHYKDAH
jgi:hypothetical protein